MDFRLGMKLFGALDVTVRNLQRQILCRVPRKTAAIGIKTRAVEIVTVVIRLAPSENAAFDFYITPLQTAGGYAERDVRRVLPVVPNRRVWIVHCRRAMHECWRTESRLTGITKIDVRADIVLEFLREAEREFVEKIVRMLAVVQCLSVPRFTGLKEKRITASAFSQRIEAHH